MGLFSRNKENKINEQTYEINGFVIGVNSQVIYHVPKIQLGATYILPNGATGLAESALLEMCNSNPQQIVVPGSFKKFNVQFNNFENLKVINLQEGVEEVKCYFLGRTKNPVDVKLPTTIKKIGYYNYPLVQNLVLPNGVLELDRLFASHDTNLLSVSIPGTIKVIPAQAFNQCRNLQTVKLNEGVETSANDIFRGTNNLRLVEIPSTYNGTLDFTMDARSVITPRGKYDVKNFTEEQNNIMKVIIKRDNKTFEFDIRRGDMPSITISQNIIKIQCFAKQQVISLDCTSLEQGIYSIENGNVKVKSQISSKVNPTMQAKKQQEFLDNLDLVFQKAVKENLDEEDFNIKGFDENDKQKIMEYMKVMFMQQVSRNVLRTDYNNIINLLIEAIKKVKEEKNIVQDSLNNKGKTR